MKCPRVPEVGGEQTVVKSVLGLLEGWHGKVKTYRHQERKLSSIGSEGAKVLRWEQACGVKLMWME